MAWEWSHSAEAYALAEKNLSKKSIKFLAECYAEWCCKEVDDAVELIEEDLGVVARHRQDHFDELLEELKQAEIWLEEEHYATDNMKEIIAKCEEQEDVIELPDCLKSDPLVDGRYENYLKVARTFPKPHLIDYVWRKAEEQATCENGGFSPRMCPHGCHTVEW